jgi:hypothetical protein
MSNLIPFKKTDAVIGVDENAVDLIYNFLNEPGLSTLSHLALGGTLPVKDFVLKIGSFAKQFWFCYDASQKQPHKQVFLAIENSNHCWPPDRKPADYPTSPENEKLFKPTTPFAFDDKNYNRKDKDQVSDFIINHIDPNKSSVSIKRADVKKFGAAMVKAFGGKKENRGYLYYPIAYFQNYDPITHVCHIDEFMKQPNIEYVRYYFGLDKSRKHKPNRIRILLFPVAGHQKSISKFDGTTDVLEKSVPPYN